MEKLEKRKTQNREGGEDKAGDEDVENAKATQHRVLPAPLPSAAVIHRPARRGVARPRVQTLRRQPPRRTAFLHSARDPSDPPQPLLLAWKARFPSCFWGETYGLTAWAALAAALPARGRHARRLLSGGGPVPDSGL